MAYSKTTWNNGAPPAITGTNLNKMENGIGDAHDHMANTSNPHSTTAAQVGAEASGAVSTHNSSGSAHSDIRTLVGNITTEVTNARGGQSNLDARLDGIDTQLAAIATEKTSYGVVSGLGVTQQAVPDMSVIVATGIIWMATGVRYTPTAVAALAVTAADATNPRIDIVYVSSAGVISYLAGTPGATPAAPATPAGGQKIAQILVTAGKTSILTADISNYRTRIGLETDWYVPTLIGGWTGTCKIKRLANGAIWVVANMSGTAYGGGFSFPTGWVTGVAFNIAMPNNSSGAIRVIINNDFVPGGTSVVGSVIFFPM